MTQVAQLSEETLPNLGVSVLRNDAEGLCVKLTDFRVGLLRLELLEGQIKDCVDVALWNRVHIELLQGLNQQVTENELDALAGPAFLGLKLRQAPIEGVPDHRAEAVLCHLPERCEKPIELGIAPAIIRMR